MESAEEITPLVLDWLDRNGSRENWMLHVHFLGPAHAVSRARVVWQPVCRRAAARPVDNRGDIRAAPLPCQPARRARDKHVGRQDRPPLPAPLPGKLENLEQVKDFIDQYDCGVRYADYNVGLILDKLRELGIYYDTAMVVTSDHGENLGEGGIYAEHATTDRRRPAAYRLSSAIRAAAKTQRSTISATTPTSSRRCASCWG